MATVTAAAKGENGKTSRPAAVRYYDPWAGTDFVIPPIDTLDGFVRWACSDAFPSRGKISYVDGVVECDMSPPKIFSHGRFVEVLARAIGNIVDHNDLGVLQTHQTLVVLPGCDFAVEPDVVFVSHESLDSGRVSLRDHRNEPAEEGEDALVLAGPPDIVVEVVSKSSVTKDKSRLRDAYEAAGVAEYWLVDARGARIEFELLVHDGDGFTQAAADADGWRRSSVLNRSFRLSREAGRSGRPRIVCDSRD